MPFMSKWAPRTANLFVRRSDYSSQSKPVPDVNPCDRPVGPIYRYGPADLDSGPSPDDLAIGANVPDKVGALVFEILTAGCSGGIVEPPPRRRLRHAMPTKSPDPCRHCSHRGIIPDRFHFRPESVHGFADTER